MEPIYTIYDRISKRCLSLSNQSTINLINGLYGKAYPSDSKVTYNWTEHAADDLRRTRTPENLSALKKLICNDIIGAIEMNEAAGNITRSEGRKLRRMTLQLYQHIYQKYEEMEEAGMNEIAEEALVLDIDIIEQEHKKEIEKLKREEEAERRRAEAERKKADKRAEVQGRTITALRLLLKGEADSRILEASGLTQQELDALREG